MDSPKDMQRPKIIGFSGKIGSGKNYISEHIIFDFLKKKGLNVSILAFADYLKISCHVEKNIPYDKLFRQKDTESRQALQNVGADKRKIDPEFFIRALDCQLRMLFDRRTDVILVCDIRHKNEMQYILNTEFSTIIIRVDAPKRTHNKVMEECKGCKVEYEKIVSHTSETDLDNSYSAFNHVINNDVEYEGQVNKELEEILNMYYK